VAQNPGWLRAGRRGPRALSKRRSPHTEPGSRLRVYLPLTTPVLGVAYSRIRSGTESGLKGGFP
jgi:hypothetical protein